VITRFLAVAGRHRRAILVIGLALSAGYLLAHLWVPSLGRRAYPTLAASAAVFLTLALVAIAQRRPAAFVVQPRVPAFSTPPQPVNLFLALAFLTLATGMAGNVIRDRGSEPFLSDQLLGLGWVGVALLHVVLVWRGQDVQLRPDGLWQRGVTGWLVIPWDAAPTVPRLPPAPGAMAVRLRFGRPELVRRHGLHIHRRALRTQDIDPRLITAAVQHYAVHPEHRAAIGTRGEYDRLMRQLLAPAIVAKYR
jgi:hypothetical protein